MDGKHGEHVALLLCPKLRLSPTDNGLFGLMNPKSWEQVRGGWRDIKQGFIVCVCLVTSFLYFCFVWGFFFGAEVFSGGSHKLAPSKFTRKTPFKKEDKTLKNTRSKH